MCMRHPPTSSCSIGPTASIMFTRYRRAATSTATTAPPVETCSDTSTTNNNLLTSFPDTSISINLRNEGVYVLPPIDSTLVTTVSELFRPAESPVDPAPDTPTITRILVSDI